MNVSNMDRAAAFGSAALAEVDRRLSLGARRVDGEYPDGADFVVIADPEGNLSFVIDAGR
jgi:hypothetical protein